APPRRGGAAMAAPFVPSSTSYAQDRWRVRGPVVVWPTPWTPPRAASGNAGWPVRPHTRVVPPDGCLAPLPRTPGSRTAGRGRTHLAEALAGRAAQQRRGAVRAQRVHRGTGARTLPGPHPRVAGPF